MDYIQIVLTSVFSIVALFFVTKILGNRQMSQMSMFDYINGITIGSIAAEAATNLDINPVFPFVAIAIYCIAGVVLPLVSNKKMGARHFIEGKPWILFKNEKFYFGNLSKQRLDVSEVLAECRSQGYFDIQDIEMIMLEHNGKMSILPKSSKRNTIPSDFNICPAKDVMAQVVVYEGAVLDENLRHTGNNDEWIKNQLRLQKINIKDIFIGMCDGDNKLNVYMKKEQE